MATMKLDRCISCGEKKLVGPLHGDKGGVDVCIPCGLRIHEDIDKANPFKRKYGRRPASDTELTLELLEAAVRLTHPDRHPLERKEQAERVTAELLALKPWVRPKAPPPPPPPPPPRQDDTKLKKELGISDRPLEELLCECGWTIPLYYCDKCRARWEAGLERQRERERAKQRERRAFLRSIRPGVECAVCGEKFRDRRKDSKYCSAACRQKAHRERNRVTDNEGATV